MINIGIVLTSYFISFMKIFFNFEKLKLLSLSLFQKINNLGNFFKNVLRAASAILGGGQCIVWHPIQLEIFLVKRLSDKIHKRPWGLEYPRWIRLKDEDDLEGIP